MAVIVVGPLAGFGYACAVVLAAVFVRAGVAKLLHPSETAAGFAALGVPAASTIARVVPVIELGLAVALLAAPRFGATAALVLLANFSGFLARALNRGVTAGCSCFGQARVEPISVLDLIRNVLLGLLAVAALFARRPVMPGIVAVVGAAIAVAAGVGLLRSLRRREAGINPH